MLSEGEVIFQIKSNERYMYTEINILILSSWNLYKTELL